MNFESSSSAIIQTVNKLCQKKHVPVQCEVASTGSLYFTIESMPVHLTFRISDHLKSKKAANRMRTLLIQKNTKMATVERFVENRIKALKQTVVSVLLRGLNLTNTQEVYAS